MANPEKAITISTMPMPKLTAVLNDFIAKTVNHLNKLSVNVEEQLQNFDKKLNDLETMTTLLEAKLNSLPPEITSQYPQLVQCSLDDVNPIVSVVQPLVVSNNNPSVPSVPSSVPPVPGAPGAGVPSAPQPGQQPNPQPGQQPNPSEASNPQPQEEEKKEEPPQEEQLSPQQKLDKFLEEHPGPFVNLCKMLKMSIPEPAVRQKAQMTGLDMDLVDEMVTLYNEAHPY